MKIGAIAGLDWDKGGGLLPAIVQHAETGTVLMLGYLNRAALERTLDDGRVTFYSRSRERLWTKGETSGHFLSVVSITTDCDRDTLLIQARPAGPVCHTGSPSCFAEAEPVGSRLAFLERLEEVIAQRIAEQPEGSYTARLYAQGPRRIAQKVGEEGVEVALAAVTADDAAVVAESADLLYHLALLLKQRGLSLTAAVNELALRHASR
ncbi:MAG: bifunctional phosphoribosyl-AMP cyclohydrolase/phosphoribosyl-ATP diphosphatase HisIE [Gammaproteobacteria bacterium]|nr:bifunctional phosphoribosyl-AMP cyclohydrolase/phosphoribosyl-ATP diphosphatase HisIE [Gammaproteobacteria bacterium]